MATLLLVEDTASERQLMAIYLQGAGHLIIHATNGAEALQKLESATPDVIVTDVVMPDMSGLELCRTLKRNLSTKKVPIVACSSKDRDLDKMWAKKQGVDIYLTKPYRKEDILEAVAFALALSGSKKAALSTERRAPRQIS